MIKQLPLVVYQNGTRIAIGMVIFNDDGSVVTQVMKDHWPTIKAQLLPGNGEVVLRTDLPVRYITS